MSLREHIALVEQYPLDIPYFLLTLPGQGGLSYLIDTLGKNKLGLLDSPPDLIFFSNLGSKFACRKHNFLSVAHTVESFPLGKGVLI